VEPLRGFAELIVDNIDADIALFDVELRYQYVSPHGIRDPALRAWIIGRTDIEYSEYRGRDPKAAHARQAHLRRAFDTMQMVQFEEALVTAEGETRHMMRKICPIIENGRATGLIGFGIDITERRAYQDALQRSEASVRSFFEHSGFGIYRSSPAGRFLVANPALVSMLGYRVEADLLALDIATEVYVEAGRRSEVVAAHGDRDVAHAQAVWKRRDGTHITVRITGRALRDAAGNVEYWEGTVEDVTQRLAAEQALRESEEQLRHAQKMEAIGQLAGGIAHDFNNLLTVIAGNVSLARLTIGAGEPPPLDELAAIDKASHDAARLVRQLLAFGRKQVQQLEPVNLNDLAIDIESMLSRVIAADITLEHRLDPGIGLVSADRGQLSQLLMNLVLNARDAMPDGGRLTLGTCNVLLDVPGAGESAGVPPGEYVMLSVEDTGHGMDEATCARAFEPFFTTKPASRGTGLGLSTVYGIVTQSGGFIRVDSAPGAGTTFRIHLPRLSTSSN